MSIKAKRNGVYSDVISVKFKRNGVYSAIVGAYVKANGAYSSVTNSTTILDFSSSLPAGVSLTRAATRRYITAGSVSSVTSGVGAFESWNSVNRGLSIDRASQNIRLNNNAFGGGSKYSFVEGLPTRTSGQSAGAGLTWTLLTESALNESHQMATNETNFTAATYCYSVYVKPNGRNRFRINTGSAGNISVYFYLDGSNQSYAVMGDGWTFVDSKVIPLANGCFKCWWSFVATVGNPFWYIGPASEGNSQAYLGDGVSGIYVAEEQIELGAYPTATIATAASPVSNTRDVVTVDATTWVNAAQGTFVVEHDLASGVLLSNGNTPFLSATKPGKIALAYSGAASRTVVNGEPSSAGGLPSISTTITLLGTTATGNGGHIKSITYYPTDAFTDAQLAALTTIPLSAGTPGALRTVAVENGLPRILQGFSGTVTSFAIRAPYTIASGDVNGIRFSMNGWALGVGATGNSVTWTKMAMDNGTQTTPVTYAASRSYSLASGAIDAKADLILPSVFGLSKFTVGDTYYFKCIASVASNTHTVAAAVSILRPNLYAKVYDPALTTMSDPDIPGAFTPTGVTTLTDMTDVPTPLMLGTFVTGDPKTYGCDGDSIARGANATNQLSYIERAVRNEVGGPYALLAMSANGINPDWFFNNQSFWSPFVVYYRAQISELGINGGGVTSLAQIYAIARRNGVERVVRAAMWPSTSSTDGWATEANQTLADTGIIANYDAFRVIMIANGSMDYWTQMPSARGVNTAKWKVLNTDDGKHPVDVSHASGAADLAPILHYITV